MENLNKGDAKFWLDHHSKHFICSYFPICYSSLLWKFFEITIESEYYIPDLYKEHAIQINACWL